MSNHSLMISSGENNLDRTVIYIDFDETIGDLYDYRSPHARAARNKGLKFITITRRGNSNIKAMVGDSDRVIEVQSLTFVHVMKAIADVREQLEIAAIVHYPGHVVAGVDINGLVQAISQSLGLPYVSARALEFSNNKFLMRTQLKNHQVERMFFDLISNEQDLARAIPNIEFPVIFKPIFGSASAFIKKCDSETDLRSHYNHFRAKFDKNRTTSQYGGGERWFTCDLGREYHYLPGCTALLEEYLAGGEGTVECIIQNGKVHPLIVHEKVRMSEGQSTILEHQLITPPSTFTTKQVSAIKHHAVRALKALGLDNSLVHLEFKLCGNEPRIIEVNPRLGGFFVNKSFQYLAGIEPFELNLDLLSGIDISNTIANAQAQLLSNDIYYTMFVLYGPHAGYLKAVHGMEKALDYKEILISQSQEHEGFADCENEEFYFAKFLGKSKDPQVLMDLYDRISEEITIEMHTKQELA